MLQAGEHVAYDPVPRTGVARCVHRNPRYSSSLGEPDPAGAAPGIGRQPVVLECNEQPIVEQDA
jgi:hypothetical protein